MTTFARVTASQILQRHRLGWIIIALWLVACCLCFHVGGPENAFFALVPLGVIPAFLVFLYLIAVFAGAWDADLLSRQSSIPRRTFLLPVPTREVVLWPMLYGAAVVAVVWTAFNLAALRPMGLKPSWWWGPLQLITLLAWFQAILWAPFPLPGLRLAAVQLLLVSTGGIYAVSAELEAPKWAVAVTLLVLLALACLSAYVGALRARSEQVPENRTWDRFFDALGGWLRRRSATFTSADQAQLWLNRRAFADVALLQIIFWSLMLLITMPFNLDVIRSAVALGMLPGITNVSAETSAVAFVLISVLLSVPLTAIGTLQARACFPSNRKHRTMSPFYATRPMTNVRLVALLHKTALRSAALLTLCAVATIIGYLLLSGRLVVLTELRRGRLVNYHDWEVALLSVGGCVGLALLTWSLMISGLFVNLSGRRWVVALASGIATALLLTGSFLTYWLTFAHPEHWPRVASILKLGGLALLAAKVIAATLTVRELRRRAWLSRSTLCRHLCCWSVGAACCVVYLHWLFTSANVSWHALALIVALFMPFSRILAAPLTLAWNRHR